MKLLAEIYRSDSLDLSGRMVTRNAVRAIIMDQDLLFMIHSKKKGDYKFPGGAVEAGEDPKTALAREIREEGGVDVTEIGDEFGQVIEYDKPVEEEFAVFKMTSTYYICKIGNNFEEQKLDPYEKDLGFIARWVSLSEALNTNKILLCEQSTENSPWVRRETLVLEQIQYTMIK